MKRIIEIFLLGTLMLFSSILMKADFYTISEIFGYSGILVLLAGEGLFIYKCIQYLMNFEKETMNIKNEDKK